MSNQIPRTVYPVKVINSNELAQSNFKTLRGLTVQLLYLQNFSVKNVNI